MFVEDSTTLADVGAALKVASASALASWWTVLNTRIHARVYRLIVRTLAARGYSAAQIASFDEGESLERDITLFSNLVAAGATENVPAALLKELDRREELRTVVVTSGGAFVPPATTTGQASTGGPDTSGDIFVWPPGDGSQPDVGPGLGETTRF